jgi:hypothetical protein
MFPVARPLLFHFGVCRLVCIIPLLVCAGWDNAAAQRPKVEHFQVTGHLVSGTKRMPTPFQLVHNVLVFKARINGHDVWAQLDNGSRDSIIDTEFAKSIGLQLGPLVAPLHTPAGGIIERRRVPSVEIEVPGQATFQSPLSAVDLGFSSKFLGRPIALILAREYFANLAFLFDLDDHTFQITPGGGWLMVPPNSPYIELKNAVPQLEIRVGDKPAVVALDLGYNGDLSLSDAAWRRLGLENLPSFQARSLRVNGDTMSEKGAVIDNITVGPITFGHVAAREQAVPAADGDGTIGFGLLSRFNFAVDIPSRRIWMISPVGSKPGALTNDALAKRKTATQCLDR